MKIKDRPLCLRPREKLLNNGVDSLTNAELLAIVISTGIKGKDAVTLSNNILKKYAEKIDRISVEDLAKSKGIGLAKAIKIKAALALGSRIHDTKDNKVIINNAKKAYIQVQEYAKKQQEYFILLTLNGMQELISKHVITIGLLDSSLFHPREIFVKCVKDRATYMIVAHNHPSGLLKPSRNDLKMTERLKDAGEIMGIKLLDSVIISRNGYISIIDR